MVVVVGAGVVSWQQKEGVATTARLFRPWQSSVYISLALVAAKEEGWGAVIQLRWRVLSATKVHLLRHLMCSGGGDCSRARPLITIRHVNSPLMKLLLLLIPAMAMEVAVVLAVTALQSLR